MEREIRNTPANSSREQKSGRSSKQIGLFVSAFIAVLPLPKILRPFDPVDKLHHFLQAVRHRHLGHRHCPDKGTEVRILRSLFLLQSVGVGKGQAGDHQQGHTVTGEVETLPGRANNFGTGYIFGALFATTTHDVQKELIGGCQCAIIDFGRVEQIGIYREDNMERAKIMNILYNEKEKNEDSRLTRSRHGQLEYLTTMNYIHKFVPPESKVLEVGAGTGRYSAALAMEGYDVTAVELVRSNLEILRRNVGGLENITSYQGDAEDLSLFADNSFDAVLVLGPMYHLFEKAEQHRALDEAIRVSKPGGIIMVAFLSVYSIMYNNYLLGNFREGIDENFDADFQVRHFKEQGFTGFDIKEFEELFAEKSVQKIALAGTDSVLELAEKAHVMDLSDEDFRLFSEYHLKTCEKRELLGTQTHLLYICRKIG